MSAKLPSVVIVGRANVGKSTLFNRLTGSRRSIVTNEPGITRDRIYGTADWRGRQFAVVDTGGLVPDERAALPREILRQARLALEDAAQIVLVTDARAGLTPLDAELARLLRRTGKPMVVAANKTDTTAQATQAGGFYELGCEVFPISAEHGLGVDELLDSITVTFPETSDAAAAAAAVQVAIVGKPNVGKSTLLNRLAGEERSIVLPEPGTTRNAVDTLVRHSAREYNFIDTAGIRRKAKTNLLAEKLSVIMARKHLEGADVALLVIDATEDVTAQDAAIAGYARDSGRSVIIVMNKWDLARARGSALLATLQRSHGQRRKPHGQREKTRREKELTGAADLGRLQLEVETRIREKLRFLEYAPILFISALTGMQTHKIFSLIDRVAEARRRRIPTGELNRWLRSTDLERGSAPAARQIKILYMTQALVAPPTFVLFTNQARPLHFSYQRFVENRLRESFDFTGTPIRFLVRSRKK